MANTNATSIGFFKAVKLCLLLLFKTEQFLTAELADNEALEAAGRRSERPARAYVVRHAFVYGFLLVAASAIFGLLLGLLLQLWLQCFTSTAVAWLQLVGACILLWGTLFVRGWDIQSHGGVTFTERVNQWLYRFLYCLGTALIVCSLVGTSCVQ